MAKVPDLFNNRNGFNNREPTYYYGGNNTPSVERYSRGRPIKEAWR